MSMGHLDGHGAIQLLVVGQVDQPEATPTDEALDAITPDALGEVGRDRRVGRGMENWRAIARRCRRECALNEVFLTRKPGEILLHARTFASLSTQFDLQGHQPPEQAGPQFFLDPSEFVLDRTRGPGPPGRLEPVADPDDLVQPGSGERVVRSQSNARGQSSAACDVEG